MDFGRLLPHEMASVDFTLPPDHPAVRRALPGAPIRHPRAYVGCPIWATKDWVGKLYPPGTKEADFLRLYTRQFNTIELNVTHYQIPTDDTIVRWREAAAPGFTFCPKVPQAISHERQLVNAQRDTDAFGEAVRDLGTHLGTCFLQLPPYFQPRSLPALDQFLKTFPAQVPLAVEFRHPDWFAPDAWETALATLHRYGASTVITDVAGRRDVLHQSLTSPTAVIRYVGNMADPKDYRRLDAWADRLADWLSQGLETLYFFVHEHDNITSPEVARHFIRALNQRTGLSLAEPHLLPQTVQGTLF